ncbi:hypothetical protein D3C85_1861750 [compost metagenome]
MNDEYKRRLTALRQRLRAHNPPLNAVSIRGIIPECLRQADVPLLHYRLIPRRQPQLLPAKPIQAVKLP